MQRVILCALLASAVSVPAFAGPLSINPDAYRGEQGWSRRQPDASAAMEPRGDDAAQVRYANASQPRLGGGFIELLFGAVPGEPYAPRAYQPAMPDYQRDYQQSPGPMQPRYYPNEQFDRGDPAAGGDPSRRAVDPKYQKQVVEYDGKERAGTIIIDTPRRFLYLVQGNGKALRYGIGVGRPGFTWSGVKSVSAKREWPDWRPPSEMLKRRPDLPHYMAGGPDNPLGARAMYLGSTLYRIHGSNEPWTIGTQVSSGCIRMRNEDVIDLYERVKIGTKVVVI
jgi:lipoprotein-anchoring transpeptidase ErfK/SrfK